MPQLAKARILQLSQGPLGHDACISHSQLHCDKKTFLFGFYTEHYVTLELVSASQ